MTASRTSGVVGKLSILKRVETNGSSCWGGWLLMSRLLSRENVNLERCFFLRTDSVLYSCGLNSSKPIKIKVLKVAFT